MTQCAGEAGQLHGAVPPATHTMCAASVANCLSERRKIQEIQDITDLRFIN